ncbi:SDR family oxidoreductase [Sphingopyxis sp. OPL5]|uniref:SDR family oxidoreductase n=1 Tax=Sphingopyxis sp. OPL5 TaxID=2486273 RepID=UPI00164D1FB2|nr:SDR family oxidoreductase [Sphingopyxis sp. OPL5]QNO27935.1 SDR family oxidoreductase [Sphingopyxis sp. OPL5]
MKSILITGASSGFGRGVSVELAQRGWRVFAAMRDTGKSGSLIEAAEAGGVADRIEVVELDVTVPASVEAAVADVLARCGGTLDGLLNNAGYSVLGAFEDLSDADCRQQMETNFFGVLAVTRAVLPSMRDAGHGRIVVVTSNAVNSPHPLLTMYAASKWALEGWAEGLAMEIAPYGVDLALIQPGAHRTEFAGNVQFVSGTGGAYAQWIEGALPGISNLDAWGRDPALAIGPIADAVTAPAVPFRQQLGEDSKIFAMLKGNMPFETRALLLRAICGLPAPGAFTGGEAAGSADYPVLSQVLAKFVGSAVKDAGLAETVARSFGIAPTTAGG